MPVASWRPDMAVQVAFNANPNDSTAVPTWTDLTTSLRKADSVTRGRQYELDQNQGSQPTLVFLDKDEYLNPANPASPYAPNVVPYRQILWQAMWPNGGTGNLLNTGYGTNPQLGTTAGYDPSFESYTAAAIVPWIAAVGSTSPVIGTTTPHGGTKDLTWTVASSSTVQGVSLAIPCIPGRQYTCSGYVRQTSASTQRIQVLNPNGSTLATGTSTTTTGAYVRLTVTFTAGQPVQTLQFATTGTATAGTVLLDDIQHEPGGSASAFTTSGPVIYGVLRDYVERWPSAWDHEGYLGRAEIVCVDAFAPLNLIKLNTEYRNAVLAKAPYYTWWLAEPQNSTSFAESSGNSGPSLVPIVSKYGAGSGIAAGTQIAITGDPNTTGVKFTPTAPQNSTTSSGTIIGAGSSAGTTFAFPASAPTTSFAATVAAWVQLTSAASPNDYQQIIKCAYWAPNQTQQQAVGIVMTAAGLVSAELWGSTYANAVRPTGTAINDNKPHLIVGTMTQASGGNTTVSIFVDGTQVGTSTVATSSPGMVNVQLTQLQVGGQSDSVIFNQVQQGVVAHVALWNRVLSTTEITDLHNAGAGYLGETSGARVTRYLGYYWTGLTSIDTGQSIMGASALAAGTDVLTACQDVAQTENGNFWVDADGNVTFAARTRRYLATTSMYTFGENAPSEYPYQGDIAFDFDPTLVYGSVEVDNADGFTAVAVNTTSQTEYFPRGYQRQINVLHDSEAVDAANYLLNQHDQPHLRVNTITLDPAGTPALWPVVLSLEIGMRVTVKRRAKAGNAGSGVTISQDFFVENISHGSIDMDAATWVTTLYLSPVDVAQVGLLDDTTYGRLGTGGAALHSSITATATSASVDLTGGDLFTTTGTPFTATIDNEIVTVTAVSGSSTPQTFTITRPTDGTASAHSAGAPVQVNNAFVLAY